jgi:hypothetical protein
MREWCATTTGRRSHVYFEDEPGRGLAAKPLTKDEPRQFAANMVKLSE